MIIIYVANCMRDFNQIMVDNFVPFNCTMLSATSTWMTVPSSVCYRRLAPDYCSLWSSPSLSRLWFSFALFSDCHWILYFLSFQICYYCVCFFNVSPVRQRTLRGQNTYLYFWTASELRAMLRSYITSLSPPPVSSHPTKVVFIADRSKTVPLLLLFFVCPLLQQSRCVTYMSANVVRLSSVIVLLCLYYVYCNYAVVSFTSLLTL